MSNLSVNQITDASGGSTASINGLTPQASNMAATFNRIINGAMTVDQRNAGAAVTLAAVNPQYTLDRWCFQTSQASKISTQQNAGSVTPPVGFSNYLGITSLSAYSSVSSDYFDVVQKVEGFNTTDLGWGTANAKTVTLSFLVQSSLTGTFSGAINNNAGGGGASYVFTYSIPVANTWTQINVTVVGPTSGTWVGASNASSLFVLFNLGSGSTFLTSTVNSWTTPGQYFGATGSVSVVGTSGATFYITGVQLEAGSTASPFAHENVGDTLQKCQRYAYIVSAATQGSVYKRFGHGTATSGTSFRFMIPLLVPMRASPSFSFSGDPRVESGNGAANWSTVTNVAGKYTLTADINTGASFASVSDSVLCDTGAAGIVAITAEL